MSSLIPQPPPSIQVGGGGAPGPGAAPGSDGPDPDSVKKNLQVAFQAMQAAAAAEGDDPDAAQYTAVAAKIHAFIAADTQLRDQVMGGGPGVKMVRKAAQGSAT